MTEIRYVLSHHTTKEKKDSSDLILESFGDAMGTGYEQRYDWQYLHNPAGRGSILFAYEGEKPVGQIASIPCRFMTRDGMILSAIAGEWLCVSPKYRGKGIMSKLIDFRLNDNLFPFVLDMPNKASINGFRRACYLPMNLKLLTRPLKLSSCFYKRIPKKVFKPFDRFWRNRNNIEYDKYRIEVCSFSAFDKRFDELFLSVLGLKIRQIRNSEFLNWRYRGVPGRKYLTIISSGEDGVLNGYITIRLAEEYGIKVGFIMDLLVREFNSNVGENLIRYALEHFWNNDAGVAAALSFPNSSEYRLLRHLGFFTCPQYVRPNPFTLFVRSLATDDKKYDMKYLMNSNNWYFVFGDYQVF